MTWTSAVNNMNSVWSFTETILGCILQPIILPPLDVSLLTELEGFNPYFIVRSMVRITATILHFQSPAVTQNRRYSESLYWFFLFFALLARLFPPGNFSALTRSTNADKWEQRRVTRDSLWAFPFAHPFIRGQAWHIYSRGLLHMWVPQKYLSACLLTPWQWPGGEELFGYFCSLVGIIIFIFWGEDIISESILITPIVSL